MGGEGPVEALLGEDLLAFGGGALDGGDGAVLLRQTSGKRKFGDVLAEIQARLSRTVHGGNADPLDIHSSGVEQLWRSRFVGLRFCAVTDGFYMVVAIWLMWRVRGRRSVVWCRRLEAFPRILDRLLYPLYDLGSGKKFLIQMGTWVLFIRFSTFEPLDGSKSG